MVGLTEQSLVFSTKCSVLDYSCSNDTIISVSFVGNSIHKHQHPHGKQTEMVVVDGEGHPIQKQRGAKKRESSLLIRDSYDEESETLMIKANTCCFLPLSSPWCYPFDGILVFCRSFKENISYKFFSHEGVS